MSSYKGATCPSESFIFFKRSIFEDISGVNWMIPIYLDLLIILKPAGDLKPHTYFILQKKGREKKKSRSPQQQCKIFPFSPLKKYRKERKTFLIYYFWILIGKLLCKFFLPLAASLPIICSFNLVFDFKIGFIFSLLFCVLFWNEIDRRWERGVCNEIKKIDRWINRTTS